MSLKQMVFKCENPEASVKAILTPSGETYLKGYDIAKALGYVKPKHAIKRHVDEEYKSTLRDLKGAPFQGPFEGGQPGTIYITEPGFYALVFKSNLKTAREFQMWVFSFVLPTLRKTGQVRLNPNNLSFKIESEFDLHVRVVRYIRRFYPDALITAGLGELQDTSSKRIASWRKGYQKGQPDIIIGNPSKRHIGFCIELKTPKGTGSLSKEQEDLLRKYRRNGYRCMVSNDYDLIVREVIEYFKDLRIKCENCSRRFLSENSLSSHEKYFHKIRCV
ncbi:phage repressor [Paramuricea clavata]|uniref:Phage repressor n=1 Tax=Paramuricea clavata TaxID=317549 RepID=A0A7D9EKN8_PARCT|nr:phage repressor [Paramuricea clavata]